MLNYIHYTYSIILIRKATLILKKGLRFWNMIFWKFYFIFWKDFSLFRYINNKNINIWASIHSTGVAFYCWELGLCLFVIYFFILTYPTCFNKNIVLVLCFPPIHQILFYLETKQKTCPHLKQKKLVKN